MQIHATGQIEHNWCSASIKQAQCCEHNFLHTSPRSGNSQRENQAPYNENLCYG